MTPGDIIATAAILSGFATAVLIFRVQREIEMQESAEINWIPWADRMLFLGTLLSLIGGVLLQIFGIGLMWSKAAVAASTVITAGYVPAILSHYRMWLACGRTGLRVNPEPSEKVVVIVTLLFSAGVGVIALVQ